MKDTSNYFVTPTYDNMKDLDAKIAAVIEFHLSSGDWSLDGDPEIKMVSGGKYQAVIPLVHNKNKSDDNRFGSR